MLRLILAWIIIINTTSATLHNTTLVIDDEAIEVGDVKRNHSIKVEVPQRDSVRVIFTLGHEREAWLGTDILPMRDTIKIDDNTETFEVEIL